jgi:Tol biopolymer transport system component
MTELGRTLERELERIAAPDFSLDAVDRVRRRRKRNQRIGAVTVAFAVAAIGAGLTARSFTGDAPEPADTSGGRITFVSPGFGDIEDRLFAASPDGTDRIELADIHAEYPEWSPDGTTIAFDDGQNLNGAPGSSPNGTVHLVDADGTDLRAIEAAAPAYAPSWSPDGKRLAVSAGRPGEEPAGISWLDIETGALTPVTTNPYGYWDHEPDVSPDGTRIAFIRIRDLAGERPLAALYVVNDDGSDLRRLTTWETDAGTPDWSPDGTQIAFNSNDRFVSGPLPMIQVIDAVGANQRVVFDPSSGYAAFWPSWSPDGSAIVFTRADFILPAQLRVIATSGGNARPLITEPEGNQVDWVRPR